MRKSNKILSVFLAMIAMFAFSACSSKNPNMQDLERAFLDAGYSSANASINPNAQESLGFYLDMTSITIHKFATKADAQSFYDSSLQASDITKAQVSMKGKYYVCFAANLFYPEKASAAIKVFNSCF